MVYNLEYKKRINSKKWDIEKSFNLEIEVLNYLEENNLYCLNDNYIFVAINLSNNKRITQNVNGFICSPEKLREILIKQDKYKK